MLADGLGAVSGVTVDPDAVQTNIVVFEVSDARELVERVADLVELNTLDATRVRAVTHLDIATEDVERAVQAIADAVR